MDIDVYSGIGLLVPLAAVAYAVLQRPRPSAWLVIAPSILFLFIGVVSNSGLAPIEGRWATANDGRYLMGTLITVASLILLVLACKTNETAGGSDKSAAGDDG